MVEEKHGESVVVGSGPNGLAAAITLTEAGFPATVYEKNNTIGGACRSGELTKPEYIYDIGSAVHPLAYASPFFRRVPLEEYGLKWIFPEASMAHPFDDGTAAVLRNSLRETGESLDNNDNKAYQKLMNPLVEHHDELIDIVMQFPGLPLGHAVTMFRFGRLALHSTGGLAKSVFKGERARAFIAGLGAHSVMSPDKPASIAAGLVLAAAGHSAGWPIPEGGAQKISDALAGYLKHFGGKVITDSEVCDLNEFTEYQIKMLDIAPTRLFQLAGKDLPDAYKRKLTNYKNGPGVFKVDWLIQEKIPWAATECNSSGTVHIGGKLDEIMGAESEVWQGKTPDKPFIILVQPSVFDKTRTNDDRHIAWGYCHVPNNSTSDMTGRIEDQIERFAPGFKERIVAKKVSYPADVERDNPNCTGGDITAGAQSMKRLLFPEISFRTPVKNTYICSAATPPGPGVHGMCGVRAANLAIMDNSG
jgi:phytoene dehydrogenase-like protein